MSEFEASSESIDISSSEEVHPNVDEKSYKNWKRQVKKEEKKKLKERLDSLNQKESLNEEEVKERDLINESLKPKITIKNEDSFRVSDPEIVKDVDSEDILYQILENPSLSFLSDTLSRNKINFNELEELILYNLSESIKEGNDDVGLLFSRLSLLLGYFRSHGKRMLDKLAEELSIPKKAQAFNEDIKKYYAESKQAILSLNK